MPENNAPQFHYLKSLGFVGAKNQLLAWATEAGQSFSVRNAKRLAGSIMDCQTVDDYKRILYADPVGESVAARWMDFHHNMAAAA